MLKTGVFLNRNTQEQFVVVISVVQNKGERIELYKRAEDYTPVDTYNSVGAYYRKIREHVYGNDELIKAYLSTYNKCITTKGELKQESKVCPKGFMVIQAKEVPSLNISSKVTMLNGLISVEEYQTEDYLISIETVEKSSATMFVDPINLKEYKIISIMSDFVTEVSDDADYYSIETLKSRYVLDHIDDCDYTVVESGDLEEAREFLHKWRDSPVKLKSFDVETTGLGVSVFGEDLITGVVMSYDWEPLGEIENSVYFPVRQSKFENNLPIEFLQEIAESILAQPDDVIILAHNGKMELNSFKQDGLDVRVDIDTYSLSTLIDTRMERGLHTLKHRAWQATQNFYMDLKNVFKTSQIRFDILPPEIVKYYACPDAPNTIKVYKYLYAQLPKEERGILKVESRLQVCKSINEYYGLRVDKEKLLKELENLEYVVSTLADIFKSIHKTSKNINSADVLRDIVYNKLNCPVVVRTKKNKPSTSVDAITNIVNKGRIKDIDISKDVPEDIVDISGGVDNDGNVIRPRVVIKGNDLKANRYPSLVILAGYNKYRKELSSLRRLVKKSLLNRVMFGINGTGAASNRQTSDAHQYSNVMKELVLSDTPEHILMSTDYPQVELRVLAYLIKDKRLIEMMKNKYVDIHRAFLSTINNIPIHLISAKMRSEGKRVNFGVVYGISQYGLAKDIYGVDYTPEQLLKCSIAITDFYNAIPGCKDLAEYNRKFVMEKGYIETEFGYRRLFPQVFTEGLDKAAVERIFRAANNTPVQGWAAHLLKRAEINLDNYIKNKGWDKTITYMGKEFPLVRIMLSIHDEVLASAHKSIHREDLMEMFRVCMEIEIEGSPPYFAVPAFIDNWYQGKSSKYEMSVAMRDSILEAWKDGKRTIVDWNDIPESIKEYRLNEITEYMNGLVLKHKTLDEVSKNVVHPEYTHSLISAYVDDDFIKSHTQEECIKRGVELFMTDKSKVVEVKQEYTEDTEDTVIKTASSYMLDIESYIEIDETGEAIIQDSVDSEFTEEDDLDTLINDTPSYSEVSIGVMCIGNVCLIDTSDITDIEDLKQMHRDIMKLADSEGYYNVSYMRGKEIMPSGLRVNPAQKELNELLSKYKSIKV